MSNTCNVCCEKYNKSLNSKITCEFTGCGFEACKTCVRTYLLGTTNDPHCMSCKNLWPAKFLIDNLNRSFVDNEYKKHRKRLLVEREISRTPELMNIVERTKLVEESELELEEINKKYIEIRKLYNDYARQLSEKRLEIHRIKTGEDSKEARKKFIMPCPGNNCKGYLSTQYKCELCKLFTCPECFEIIGYSKEDHHVCKDENLKSAEMIKKETKGCPKCGVRIFKISGCDQMWCTECKVEFSWNTGKIVISGAIHNPHYYNYLQQNGGGENAPRNPGDVLCGGLIPFYILNSIMRWLTRFNQASWYSIIMKNEIIAKYLNENNINEINSLINVLSSLHRCVNHITNVDLINAREKVRTLENHDNLTVQYILNKKTKDELATNIFKNDNQRKKFSELLNIYELLSVVGIERFNSINNNYDSLCKKYSVKKNDSTFVTQDFVNFILTIINFINEFNYLIDYTNKQLSVISYTYNLNVNILKYNVNGHWDSVSKKFKHSDIVNNDKKNEASCSYH